MLSFSYCMAVVSGKGVDYRNLRQYLDNPETTVWTLADLCPHSYPDWCEKDKYGNFVEDKNGDRVVRSYIERTDDGWVFRSITVRDHVAEEKQKAWGIPVENVEPRFITKDYEWHAGLLDNGADHRQYYWNGNYRLTEEGKEGWLLPSSELFFEIMYRVMLLDKDPQHQPVTRPFLADLRENLGNWPLLADHVQYGDSLSARITNPYGKDVGVDIPVYEGDTCVLAEGQDEQLLGSQVLSDEFSWLEALVGNKWPLLPQVIQFVASRVEDDFQYSKQGEESEPTISVHNLRETRLWTPDQAGRNTVPGRIVSVDDDVGGDWVVLGFGYDYDGWPAFGVRCARE